MKILIYGYGPNLGSALKDRFVANQHEVIGVTNNILELQPEKHFSLVATNEFDCNNYLDVEVIIYNGSYYQESDPLKVCKDEFEASFQRHLYDLVGLLPILNCMKNEGRGKLIVTSNSLAEKGAKASVTLAAGKAVLESYTKSLAISLKPETQVYIVKIMSKINGNSTVYTEDIAQIYYNLAVGINPERELTHIIP